jgi:hypothetical protein
VWIFINPSFLPLHGLPQSLPWPITIDNTW